MKTKISELKTYGSDGNDQWSQIIDITPLEYTSKLNEKLRFGSICITMELLGDILAGSVDGLTPAEVMAETNVDTMDEDQAAIVDMSFAAMVLGKLVLGQFPNLPNWETDCLYRGRMFHLSGTIRKTDAGRVIFGTV